jgi:membrane protease YdiL (CAAX protease family)
MSHALVAEPLAEAPFALHHERPVGTARATIRKVLLACGVASSVLYVGAEIYAWTQYPGYRPISQVYSELLAEGAPTRAFLILIAGAPYNLLVAGLAGGVWLSAARTRRRAHITAVLLTLYALCSFLGGTIFQMDVRGAEPTARGALHPVVTGVMVVFMLLSLGCGAFLHGGRFRVYTLGTLLTILVFAGLTLLAAPSLAANEPTPWLGLLERVSIYAWMLWVAVLGLSLWPSRFCSPGAGATELKAHAVLAYFALTCAISWGGLLLLGGPGAVSAADWGTDPRFVAALVVTLAGPSLAGLALTGLVDGRAGYRTLLARLVHWRVGVRWYALALLATPALYATVLVVLSRISPVYVPDIVTSGSVAAVLVVGISSAIVTGALEELGWTGFAVPRLRLRHDILATGLIVGVVWGAWHALVFLERDTFAAALPLSVLLARLFSWLPAYRVLMVWLYDRTHSLLLAMLMHASLVASTLILMTVTMPPMARVLSIVAWAAALWLAVAALAWFDGHLTRAATVEGQVGLARVSE